MDAVVGQYESPVLTNVPVSLQSGVITIAAGYGHLVALKNDGSVVLWEFYGVGETNVPLVAQSGVTAIAAGYYQTVALINGPVTLHAIRRGSDLVLIWPFSGYALQSADALTQNATWNDVTNTPALLGAHWAVTNTFSGNARFYRLRKPYRN